MLVVLVVALVDVVAMLADVVVAIVEVIVVVLGFGRQHSGVCRGFSLSLWHRV